MQLIVYVAGRCAHLPHRRVLAIAVGSPATYRRPSFTLAPAASPELPHLESINHTSSGKLSDGQLLQAGNVHLNFYTTRLSSRRFFVNVLA